MKKIFPLLLVAFSFICNAQKNNIWQFGNGAGLNFNNSLPSALSGGQTLAPDNTTSVSDDCGALLFYTNGATVWNKNHSVMSNGSGLTGHSSAGQCALIIPHPANNNTYIIFHVSEFSAPGYLNYSVVDMNLNSGLGDVVSTQKNISLGTGWTEKLCAYYNSQGNFYWLFSHKWNSNQFVAFKIDVNSIATQSVVSSIGSIHNCGSYGSAHDAMGQLTISPDGSKLVNALTCQDKYELFDLNINTGVLSNLITISGNTGNAWGTAFSANSKMLYVTALFNSSFYQYDISSNNQTSINASKYVVTTIGGGGYTFGYLEMGPDSLIYVAKPGANYISVVNNANNTGAACNFSLTGPSLGSNTSSHGLSRLAYNIPLGENTVNIAISGWNETTVLCAGQSVTLTATGSTSYTWNPGGTGSSIVVSPTVTTTYSVTGGTNSCLGNSQITLNVTNCTDVKNIISSEKLGCFPNPFDEILFLSEIPESTLQIYSIDGEVVFSKHVVSNEKLDLRSLKSGIYFLELSNNFTRKNCKIIKR